MPNWSRSCTPGTSTGAQSDAKTLCAIAHKHHALTIVDAVTSLGGSPLKVDDWALTPSIPLRRSVSPAHRACRR